MRAVLRTAKYQDANAGLVRGPGAVATSTRGCGVVWWVKMSRMNAMANAAFCDPHWHSAVCETCQEHHKMCSFFSLVTRS